MHTSLFWPGQPRHLVQLLDGSQPRARYLVLGGHGDARGFLLPELAEELHPRQPFHTVMTPEDVKDHLRFDRTVVVSTACSTGTEEMAEAFLSRGAGAYLAPTAYPDGSAALHFVNCLFYAVCCSHLSVGEAHREVKPTHSDFRMFTLYQR